MKTNITKALEMRENIQAKHGNECVVLFRTAGEYELYGRDALALYVAEEGLTAQDANGFNIDWVKLTQNKIEVKTERARFTFDRLDQVLRKMIRAGHRVCIVDAPIDAR